MTADTPQGTRTAMGLLKEILHSSRYKAASLASATAYWLLYMFSSGMLQYYRMDLTPLLRASRVPNPYYLLERGSLVDFYNSGMVWYPTGHLQVNLLFGPTFFSVLLSGLFALNILVLVYSFSIRGLKKGTGIGGLVGMVPALFSGGCCSVPLGMVLFSSLLSSRALFSFAFSYAYITNALVAVLMYVSLVHTLRKATVCNCAA